MSVFPAYADAKIPSDVAQESWLENNSFQLDFSKVTEARNSFDSINNVEKDAKKSESLICTKGKKKYKKTRNRERESDVFYIDKKSNSEFLTVKTICRPSVAKYKISYYLIGTNKKKEFFKRYFKKIKEAHSSASKEEINKDLSGKELLNSDFDTCKEQKELMQTTAFYNKSLSDEPNNVEMWLKFIDFQDVIFKSEKTFKKGSFAKALRTSAERKLSILEKALSHNPNSEDLHRKRLNIMVSVYPADELQKHLKILLEKDTGNIILWQGYIEATQCSMSHCNTLSVLNLYILCLSNLHKLKRNTGFDNKILEESILRIVYQCGLFLKQSGLFERLWTLLKMYLEINLGDLIQNSFNITVNCNEKQLLELEDMVFKSQLPRHELWLRVEKLRESCHWLPVIKDCSDPQRIIFTNDVFELIQPITMEENTFRLIVSVLTLLKIPLLPCRHNTMQEVGLDHVPWALDSIETVLPIFFEMYPINSHQENFLIDFHLVVGPQYLKVLPGQEEYLNFMLNVMQRCIDCLKGKDKCSLIIWWLRFQRLLIILNNNGRFKLPDNIKKYIKSNVKSLLKKPENRNNAVLFIEYALLEKEMTSNESCMQILQIALSFFKNKYLEPLHMEEEQAVKCYLIRTLVETMINMKKTDEALRILVNFVLENSVDLECDLNEDILNVARVKFEQLTVQFLQQKKFEKLGLVEHFLPIFLCDWIICYSWFMYLTKGPSECATILDSILDTLNSKTNEKLLQIEIIYEFYVAVMFKSSIDNPSSGICKAMEDIMHKSLQYSPNNLCLLSTLAKKQCMLKSLGPRWWKIKTLLLNSGHALPVLLLIITSYHIMIDGQETCWDLGTGTSVHVEATNLKFRMLSLYKEATKMGICTRRCGLIWRLYLQFVYKYFDTNLCKKIYYSAVEECPWLKVSTHFDTLYY
ncbi:hypothetical protein WA026_003698 [Henosepilachna vigintioctopunctata]|uniref:Protein NRDE2 homolog n=1 Tax=Henosepilachna vigintioctopunctata TaxID=420089 RepID=A0AAW1UFE5_9CUCU